MVSKEKGGCHTTGDQVWLTRGGLVYQELSKYLVVVFNRGLYPVPGINASETYDLTYRLTDRMLMATPMMPTP